MLMPKFLLSHQTTLVLFCSLRDPKKRGIPKLGRWPDPTEATQPCTRDAACSPLNAHTV